MSGRCGIEITSFLGSIGAEHYYGEAWWDDKSAKYGFEDHKLEYALTAKQAAYLNKKDHAWGTTYRRGDTTGRFDTKQQALDAGIKFLTEKFGENIQIELGSRVYLDNEIIYNNGVRA